MRRLVEEGAMVDGDAIPAAPPAADGATTPSSILPSQLSSMPLQSSRAAGLMAALPSLQSE